MKKQIFILAALSFVLLVLLYAVNRTQPDTEEIISTRFFNFSPDDVVEFEINNFTLGLRFQKMGETQWTVKRFKNTLAQQIETKEKREVSKEDSEPVPANPLLITTLLERIIPLEVSEPVAVKPESSASLQILPQGLHVVFYDRDKKELGTIHVGKQGMDVYSTFVKRPDENNIYLVDENLRGLLLIQYEEWLLRKDK